MSTNSAYPNPGTSQNTILAAGIVRKYIRTGDGEEGFPVGAFQSARRSAPAVVGGAQGESPLRKTGGKAGVIIGE